MDSRQANRDRAHRVTLSGMLLAIMLVLGWVEHILPSVPIPGVKLGLSNGVLIFAVYMLDLPTAWILMALKVTLSGLMFSGVSAMLFGFAGGVLSMLAMTLLSRAKVPCVAVSMVGGLAHNAGQLLLAMRISMPKQALLYMAILAAAGLVCGLLTGVAAERVIIHLHGVRWLNAAREKKSSMRSRIASAVIVVLAGLLAWYLLPKPSGTVVITSSLDAPAAQTTAEGPPHTEEVSE